MSKKSLSAPPSRRQRMLALGAVIALGAVFLALQGSRLTVPPWDCFSSWREADTYSIAVNYYQYAMELLRPQFNYDGVAGNYAQLELQILPFLSACVFHLLGRTSWVVCRVLSLLFFMGSAAYLCLLLRRFLSLWPAVLGLGVYLFTPLSTLMAASVQPESCALFFFCGAAYYLKRYHDAPKARYMIGASVMTAFSIMEKTPAAFIGLLFLFVFFSALGKRALRSPVFYAAGAICLLPPLALTLYTSQNSVFRFVDGIADKHILTSKIFSLFTPEALRWFFTSFRDWFGLLLVVLAAAGFVLAWNKKYRFFFIWAAAFALECATIVAIIKFDYYLVFLLPIFAALAAVTFEELRKCARPLPLILAAGLLFHVGYLSARQWQKRTADISIQETGAFVEEMVPPGEAIAVGDLNPAYLDAANRNGYRANIMYYDYIPIGPQAETDYLMDHGVRWFVVVNDAIVYDDGTYLAYVKDNFPLYASNGYCAIYDMRGGDS